MKRRYVPIRFLKNLVDLVCAEEGLPIDEVLRETCVTSDLLITDDGLATFSEQIEIYERVAALSERPGIGFRSPSANNFADQGLFGAVMLMAGNVGEAFKVLDNYLDVLGPVVEYKLIENNQDLIIRARDKAPMTPAGHRLITEENLAVWKFSTLPIPDIENYAKEIRIDYPEPPHSEMYRALFNPPVKFGCDHIEVVLDRNVTKMTMPTSNPDAFARLEELCREELAHIQMPISGIVLDILERDLPSKQWRVNFICDAIEMNEKALRRALNAEGTTPNKLIQKKRDALAMKLMENDVSDEKIANDTGYASRQAFINAFTNRIGITPAQYRKKNRVRR